MPRRVATTAHSQPLSGLELASGVVVGRARPSADMPARPPIPLTPIEALENAVRPALQRGPCLVSFSGGHDSSLVLGVATRVARAEGLALPIPMTFRFVDAPRAEESQVQEDVVSALGLTDWVRRTADDELDFVGPVAQQVLCRHGPLYPANAFVHAPLLAAAAGGTLLTGVGGDQVFMPTRRPRRPWPLASRAGPYEGFPWLRPASARRVCRTVARERRRMPRDPAGRSRWRAEDRSLEITQHSLRLIADDAGARVEHPLLDHGLLCALEDFGLSPNAAGGRAALLARMFADHVPPACLFPRPKAMFGQVLWNRYAREHIVAWDGGGIDDTIVDVDGLRAQWHRDRKTLFTAMLLQQTWLAKNAAGSPSARRPSEASSP